MDVNADVNSDRYRRDFLLCVLALLLLYGSFYLSFFDLVSIWEDIYFVFTEGQRLLSGENPYARVLAGDMLHNDKYATYFPASYIGAAVPQWLGVTEYADWLRLWRWILLGTILVTTLFMLGIFGPRQQWLSLFLVTFWLFNRWIIEDARIAHLDIPALLFLILSLQLLPRRPRWAALSFGMSLAIKHIAIFLLPLYLIWRWQRERSWHTLFGTVFWIALIPVLLSLPFLIWEPLGFVKSILFSATRLPEHSLGVDSLDALMGWVGLPAKLPMLALMGGIYALAWHGRLNRWGTSFLVLSVFTGYNSVMFQQYMAWPLTLLPFLFLRADGDGVQRPRTALC